MQLGNYSRFGVRTGPSWGPEQAPPCVLRCAQVCSAPAQDAQGCSLSAQTKAAAAQVRGCNWNWEKKILCPTMEVFEHKIFFVLPRFG